MEQPIVAKFEMTPVPDVQGMLIELWLWALDGPSGWNPVLVEVSGKCAKDSNRTKISTPVCIRIIFQYLLLFGDSIFEILWRTLERGSQGSILVPWEPVAVPAASIYVLFLPSSANGKWQTNVTEIRGGTSGCKSRSQEKALPGPKAMCSGGKERKEEGGGMVMAKESACLREWR